jgi:hypothetical protein
VVIILRSITKIFKEYTIKSAIIKVVNGNIVTTNLQEVKTFDTVTSKTAPKIVKQILQLPKNETVVIKEINFKEKKYRMTAEDFLEKAVEVKI